MALSLLSKVPKLSKAGSKLTTYSGKLLAGTTSTAVGGGAVGYGFANLEHYAQQVGIENDQTIRYAIFAALALGVVFVIGQLFTIEL